MRLRDLIQALKDTYCRTFGAEYMYINDTATKRFVQTRLEPIRSRPTYPAEQRRHILERLTAAETLERYLHTKYVGQKRFSGEGGETMIPMLDHLIQIAGAIGVQETVIGMAHRGRLNVLVNTLGKMPADLFSEFEGRHTEELLAGDVKYHQGFSSDVVTPGGPMHLTLAFNPSHLEAVNPVVEGSVRARQHRRGDEKGVQVLPVLIHGDAALAGQGVGQEVLNMAQTRGFYTGGTIHIVVNNQIGFTTSDPRDTRGTLYCTDIAKMAEAPIFHVNADDPEVCLLAVEMAMAYRQQFHRDVFIDLVCFRRLGHNEADEPMLTQPLMYKRINQHPGTRKVYADRLIADGVVKPEEAEAMIATYRAAMDKGLHTNTTILANYKAPMTIDWSPYRNRAWTEPADTAVPLAALKALATKVTEVPDSFKLHPRVARVLADRRAMGEGKLPLDWGMGETLAYATLLRDGYGVRLSGQDVGRGTFSHRHAVLHDQNREKWDSGIWIPLERVTEGHPAFEVIDSVLTENAVLGFEYGYATSDPKRLVIWEAQFGDFANGAQVVIDQFIAAGEAKWGRICGLVMLLPHGYEGQGPEHSSARPERYLQLCAEHNMQVCVPTTPAQIFHLLRRQMIRPYRRPLIVMSPKSLLRHKEAVSSLDDLAGGAVPERDRRDGEARREERAPRHRLHGQGLFRARRLPARAQVAGRRDHPAGAALPVPARRLQGRAREVPARDRGGLVPGGAAEPGRVVSAARVFPCRRAAEAGRRVRRPPGVGVDGGRLHVEAPRTAAAAGRGRLRARLCPKARCSSAPDRKAHRCESKSKCRSCRNP